MLDWVPGAGLAWAFLEVSGPPLLSCPSVFSLVGTSSSSCALCWRTHSHAVCLGNMWGALLCAPHHMEGTRTWLASWLARAGAWESLCYFHSSVLSLYCAGGFCAGSKADGLLHSGTYFVSCFCDPALYQYTKHHSWFALCFHSPHRAFSQTETNLCVLLSVLPLPVALSSALL